MDSREGLERSGDRPGIEVGLALAGTLTTGMALYHFWLPYAFRWGDVLTRVPALRWGLFLINASFSYLLLVGGVLTLAMAFRPALKQGVGRVLIAAMAGYWAFNAGWQVLSPFPMPRGFEAMRWAFLGFAAAVTILYLSALVGGRAPRDAAQPLTLLGSRRTPGRFPGAR